MSTYGYQITILILVILLSIMVGFSLFLIYGSNPPERNSESIPGEIRTVSAETLRPTNAVTRIPFTEYALKSNALTLWSLHIRERFGGTGIFSESGEVMYVFDIPSEVFCHVGAESSSWYPLRSQRWILKCKTYDFTDSIVFVINGVAAQGLTGGVYYDNTVNPILVYGMGDWPEFCYVTDVTIPVTSTPVDRRELDKTATPSGPNSPKMKD